MVGLGSSLIEREKSEQPHGFLGSLLSLPSQKKAKEATGALDQRTTCLGAGLAAAAGRWGLAEW